MRKGHSEIKEGNLIEENGVKMLIVKVFRNGDFIALSENTNFKKDRYSICDPKAPKLIDTMDSDSFNILKQVMDVI
ncbi:hypothetical protein HNP89_000957 [Methanococcus maripaludis]|uniref:Uncharacterized protein n=1 Tax=Methanococcus maripaludis TaxID=39152 RepID=A0A7J9NZ89_METMI|nr:hypothetical protein [Methanococcus maripaludis]MBA2853000.1 hypothetical protein [Methanococcus maripaludis]